MTSASLAQRETVVLDGSRCTPEVYHWLRGLGGPETLWKSKPETRLFRHQFVTFCSMATTFENVFSGSSF